MPRWVKDIRLVVAGAELTGWDAWDVDSDMLTPANAWRLGAPNPGGLQAWAVDPGDRVRLVLDGHLEMVGRVDDVVTRTGPRGSRIEVTGRDEMCHLVDTSATPGTLTQMTLATMAQRLGAAWSMQWQVEHGLTLKCHKRVKVEPGETPMEVLQRLARKEHLLIWAMADGVGYIGRPDYKQAPTHRIRLHLPGGRARTNNVTASTVTRTWRQRYKTITVAGTSASDATAWGRTTHRRAVVTDSGVTVARPIIITAGDVRSVSQAAARATLALQSQVMDATTAEYTVPGHYGTPYAPHGTPAIWEPGQLVDVVDEPAALAQVMILTHRRLSLSAQGPSTTLTLHPMGWLS